MEETKKHLSTEDKLDNPQMFAERTNKWMNQGVDKIHIVIPICVCDEIEEVKYLCQVDQNHILNQLWNRWGKSGTMKIKNNTSITEKGWPGKCALGMWLPNKKPPN